MKRDNYSIKDRFSDFFYLFKNIRLNADKSRKYDGLNSSYTDLTDKFTQQTFLMKDVEARYDVLKIQYQGAESQLIELTKEKKKLVSDLATLKLSNSQLEDYKVKFPILEKRVEELTNLCGMQKKQMMKQGDELTKKTKELDRYKTELDTYFKKVYEHFRNKGIEKPFDEKISKTAPRLIINYGFTTKQVVELWNNSKDYNEFYDKCKKIVRNKKKSWIAKTKKK